VRPTAALPSSRVVPSHVGVLGHFPRFAREVRSTLKTPLRGLLPRLVEEL
jgi:hypothetical protein